MWCVYKQMLAIDKFMTITDCASVQSSKTHRRLDLRAHQPPSLSCCYCFERNRGPVAPTIKSTFGHSTVVCSTSAQRDRKLYLSTTSSATIPARRTWHDGDMDTVRCCRCHWVGRRSVGLHCGSGSLIATAAHQLTSEAKEWHSLVHQCEYTEFESLALKLVWILHVDVHRPTVWSTRPPCHRHRSRRQHCHVYSNILNAVLSQEDEMTGPLVSCVTVQSVGGIVQGLRIVKLSRLVR